MTTPYLDPNVPDSPRAIGDVEKKSGQLRDEIDQLATTLDVLRSRLSPVLRETTAIQEETTKGRDPCACALSKDLDDYSNSIVELHSSVRRLIEMIEL